MTLTVSSMELEVNISQLNFVPQKCVITGSSPAGMTREHILEQLANKERDEDPFVGTNIRNVPSTPRPEDADNADDSGTTLERKAMQLSLTKQIGDTGLGATVGGRTIALGSTSTLKNSKLRRLYGDFESYSREAKLPSGGIGSGGFRDAAGDYNTLVNKKRRLRSKKK